MTDHIAAFLACASGTQARRPRPPQMPRRRVVMGDPQAQLTSIATALATNGILGDDGWMDPQTQLVVIGDFFDYHPHPPHAAADGLAFLMWCAAHDARQVVMLLGNHDLARVSSFHGCTLDDHQWNLQQVHQHDQLRTPAERRAYRLHLRQQRPTAPPLMASRDYQDFHPDQTVAMRRLLQDGRFQLASREMVHGHPAIASHAGMTINQLTWMHGYNDTDPVCGANAWLRSCVASSRGAPIHLHPLITPWSDTTMFGGLLIQRPTHPADRRDHHVAFGYDLIMERDVHPAQFAPGVQIIGHTAHPWSARYPDSWVTPAARASKPQTPHRLTVHGSVQEPVVTYDTGWTVDDGARTTLLWTDGMLGGVDPATYPLLDVQPQA